MHVLFLGMHPARQCAQGIIRRPGPLDGPLLACYTPVDGAAQFFSIVPSRLDAMPVDPQILGFLSEHNKNPVSWPDMTAQKARNTANTLLKATLQHEVDKVEDTETDAARKVPLRIYTPKSNSSKKLPVLVYFHGGGWVTGSVEIFDGVCRALAAKSGTVVISVEYKLSPEHRFPEGLEDAYAATCWVAEHAACFGGDAQQLAVGGDSAGGNFAAAVSILARDRSGPSIKLQLLLYPVVQYEDGQTGYSQSAKQNSHGYYLDVDKLAWYFKQYLVNPPEDGKNPLVSVLLTKDLSNLPPAVVITAEYDILKDQGRSYADRLEQAGVPVQYKDYPGQIHSFIGFAVTDTRTNVGLQAIDDVAQHLRDTFHL